VRVTVTDGPATRELRRAVLRPSWPAGSPMHGDDNPAAVHLAAFDDNGTLVGACLVLPNAYPLRPDAPHAWQLRGMATTPGRRGNGIGGLVVAAAVAETRRRYGLLVWCDARTAAVEFYRRNGFTPAGEEFSHHETGAPHYRMWRDLGAEAGG
jgi:GNAT superfamily N-acetyltransferase